MNPLLFSLLVLLIPASAWSHARLLPAGALKPRNTNAGNKGGPCGVPRTSQPTVLAPGQVVTVEWEEVIDHPGYYRIAFSPSGDRGFDQNILADHLTDLQGGTLPHRYSTTVTLPTAPCEQCTIQLIQYMSESQPPSLYYSCADIAIRSGDGGPGPDPTPSPSPTPTPTPSNPPDPAPGPISGTDCAP